MQSFGKNLKTIRESCGFTQKKLAELMKIPQQRISEWELGKVEPSLYSTIRLIKCLNSSFEELTDGMVEDD